MRPVELLTDPERDPMNHADEPPLRGDPLPSERCGGRANLTADAPPGLLATRVLALAAAAMLPRP